MTSTYTSTAGAWGLYGLHLGLREGSLVTIKDSAKNTGDYDKKLQKYKGVIGKLVNSDSSVSRVVFNDDDGSHSFYTADLEALKEPIILRGV